jgi:hypothetical protein
MRKTVNYFYKPKNPKPEEKVVNNVTNKEVWKEKLARIESLYGKQLN